jgi:hypothetical protein
MPVPLIAAGAMAVATVGGAAISSHASSKAASKAAAAQTQNTNANNALQLDIYNRNTANFAPYSATGLRAMGTLNGLLYGNGGPAMLPASSLGTGGSVNALASGGAGYAGVPYSPSQFADGAGIGHNGGPLLDGDSGLTGVPQPQNGVTAQAPNAQDAWDQFRNGSQYQWRLGQGFNALNQGLAGQGALHSGAAEKAAIRYGQGFASNELGNFINLLQGQQNLGFGGAQALAGVGNNYGNQVTANNNNAADAASNAALLRGQATGQFIGTAANALGNFASSFGGGGKPAGYAPPTWGGSGNAPWYVGY